MKLEDLIRSLGDFRNETARPDDCDLLPESLVRLIYMESGIAIGSEISIFTFGETDDEIRFERDGVNYVQLFPSDYMIELIESDLDLGGKGYSPLQIANRLIEYRLNDA